MVRAYHWLKADMTSGSGDEPPWKAGETRTMKRGACISLCHSGYHSSPTPWAALQYAPGPMLCLVDVSKPRDKVDGDKQVSSRRKLIKAVDATNTLHKVAVRIALDVLPFYEKQYPADQRPRLAIEAKQKWLKGEITDKELDAARDAARAAARDAAWDAARAAAWAAAWDAARAAAWDAARDAARAAARDAALKKYVEWGNEMLLAALEKAQP